MSAKDCIEHVRDAGGGKATDDDLDRIFTEMQARVRRKMAAGEDPAEAARAAGEELASEKRLASAIEQRGRKINLLRKQGIEARIREGHEVDDIRALLTGREKVGRNDALSVDAMAHGLVADVVGPMVADLEKAGLRRALTRRDMAFDRDVARELWRREDPTTQDPTGNAQAAKAAEILDKHQEHVRALQNDAGAWIGKADHYITRQSHDMWKIRGKGEEADYRAWRDTILPKLDPTTFDHLTDPNQVEPFLKATWHALASGVHEGATGSAWLGGFKGPSNLAKKVSQERKLHFKSADDWFDYNRQFGHGAVVDGVIHGMERGARNAAVMRTFGTNPDAMFNGMMDRMIVRARDRGDFKAVDKLRAMQNGNLMDAVTGKAELVSNKTAATVGATVRNVQSLSKLGGVVLSSLPDIAINAAVARHNGIGLLEAYAKQAMAVLPDAVHTNGAARKEIAQTLGVGIDGLLGGIVNRFKGEHGPLGKMSRTVELFHKLNGLTYWIDSMKEGLGLMLTHNLGRNAGKDFDSLHPMLQKSLRRYGMEAPEWDAMRQAALKAPDGNMHLLPAEIDNLPDEAVSRIGQAGVTPDQVRADLRNKLSTYVIDQTREGMSEPTAATRSLVQGAYQKAASVNPWLGEAIRAFMQFKTFPLTHFSRSIMRELSRDGVDMAGIAHLIVGTTALGYVAMTLKQLAMGRNPRNPQTPGEYAKTAMAAMAQGGGLGLYGDFLFGEANRFGGGPLDSFMGPTYGTLDQLGQLLQGLRDGTATGGEALQFAKGQAPFLNLFYTRAALDYFVFYRLQEMMAPGYLRRYERNVQRTENQTFWLSPSWSPEQAMGLTQ